MPGPALKKWRTAATALTGSLLCAFTAAAAGPASLPECLSTGTQDPRPAVLSCERWLEDTELPVAERTKLYIHLAMLHAQWNELVKARQYLDTALLRNSALLEDNLYRYNWLRQRGIIELRREDYRAALPHFEESLRIVRLLGRDLLAATVHNDLGTIYRELGDYTAALGAFERALELRKAEAEAGDYSAGLMLANIAGVYRDLGNLDEARLYLNRALTVHQLAQQENPALQDYVENFVAHVHEDLGATELDAGNLAAAAVHLDEANSRYAALGRSAERARVLVLRGRLANRREQPAPALQFLGQANRLLAELDQQSLLELKPELAAVYLQLGELEAAETVARSALTLAEEKRHARVSMLLKKTLADIYTAQGRPEPALASMREHMAAYEKLLDEKYAEDFSILKANIEIDEQRKANALLEKDNQIAALTVTRQRLALAVGGVLALLLLTILAWIWRSRQQDARRLEEERAAHQAELSALSRYSERLLDLLDSTPYPLICIDEGGRLLHANAPFRTWCGKDFAEQARLADVLPDLQAQLMQLDLDGNEPVEAEHGSAAGQERYRITVRSLDHSDGYLLVLLQPLSDVGNDDSALAQVNARSSQARQENLATYRQALVDLMLGCVEVWEAATGDDRIALAERSSIWQVAIDDGRVRTRTMEKYLSVQRLPGRPRWRQVVRTCRYILINCPLSASQRGRLEQLLNQFMSLERARALEA